MKYREIIAGYSYDLASKFYIVVPDSWNEKKIIRKFQKENPEYKVFGCNEVDGNNGQTFTELD